MDVAGGSCCDEINGYNVVENARDKNEPQRPIYYYYYIYSRVAFFFQLSLSSSCSFVKSRLAPSLKRPLGPREPSYLIFFSAVRAYVLIFVHYTRHSQGSLLKRLLKSSRVRRNSVINRPSFLCVVARGGKEEGKKEPTCLFRVRNCVPPRRGAAVAATVT